MTPSPNLDSLLARLRNQARQRGLPAQQMLLFYFHERLLARVAHSPYRDRLVLKGGLNLYSRYGAAARPTVDIDLLGLKLSPRVEDVARVFAEIVQVELGQANTRLKDFYDLYWILQHEAPEAELLGEAIRRSFAARGTPRGGHGRILALLEGDGPELWRRFLRKNPLEAPPDFAAVVEGILAKLKPFLDEYEGLEP